MKERLFRFKRFKVSHARSSMPVGVDGVLIGAWADVPGSRVLDVGTGCGLIALMIAQRAPEAEILGIDIHAPSIEEARENFSQSPWSDRLRGECVSFSDIEHSGSRFDLVVSNPPFFKSGVKEFDSARIVARHQGELSPESLIKSMPSLLSPKGRLCMILPATMYDDTKKIAAEAGVRVSRSCFVRDNDKLSPKRVMMEFMLTGEGASEEKEGAEADGGEIREELVLFDDKREPTMRHRQLCGDFYLRF